MTSNQALSLCLQDLTSAAFEGCFQVHIYAIHSSDAALCYAETQGLKAGSELTLEATSQLHT